jgi:hypothetical protein
MTQTDNIEVLLETVDPDSTNSRLPGNQVAGVGCFEYRALPVSEEVRDELKASARLIRGILQQTLANVVAIGKELAIAKKKVGHGNFLKWIAAEFGFSDRSAANYMRAAEWCADKFETVSNLQPATVYLLASNGTPESVKNEVIARLQKGEVVTPDVARMLAREARATERLERREATLSPRTKRRHQRAREEARVRKENALRQRELDRQEAEAAVGEIVQLLQLKLGPDLERVSKLLKVASQGGIWVSDIIERACVPGDVP